MDPNLIKLIKILPRLNVVNEQNVLTWYDKLVNLIQGSGVQDEEIRYRLAFLATSGEARRLIKELKEEMPEEVYPNLIQIKNALLNIKDRDHFYYYDKLKAIKLKVGQNLFDFNSIYLEYYNKLPSLLKEGFTVKDYVRSIEINQYACFTVIYEGVETIEEACRITHKIQNIINFEECVRNEQNFYYEPMELAETIEIKEIKQEENSNKEEWIAKAEDIKVINDKEEVEKSDEETINKNTMLKEIEDDDKPINHNDGINNEIKEVENIASLNKINTENNNEELMRADNHVKTQRTDKFEWIDTTSEKYQTLRINIKDNSKIRCDNREDLRMVERNYKYKRKFINYFILFLF